MHLEFRPEDAPDPSDADVEFGVGPEQITAELFGLCELFFRQASRSVHVELDQFLTERDHSGGVGWFLDALGITATLDRAAVRY